MRLTKFQHACFTVEKDTSTVIIDPGIFSHDFIMPHRVAAIIITHEHTDHLDEALITRILTAHPHATLIAHESISGRFTQHQTVAAKVGETYTFGPFALRFFGGTHAAIADSVPVPPNLGVLINDSLYYPGDSFTIPEEVAVTTLALPAAAPWMKISEAMAFLQHIKPQFAFPTHDGILSTDGKSIVDRMLGAVAGGQGTVYKRLDESSIDI